MFGVSASYQRGSIAVALRVIPYNPAPRVVGAEIKLKLDETLFLVNAADLDFGSGPVSPEAGDVIQISGGPTYRFPRDGVPVPRGLGPSAQWQIKLTRISL